METRPVGPVNQRQRPKLRVARGYNFADTANALTKRLAPGVAIMSGQALQEAADGLWYLAGSIDTDNPRFSPIYWAISDSAALDVQNAGSLNALSSSGQYEFWTPWYNRDTDHAYTPGTLLVPDPANPGSVIPLDPDDTDLIGAPLAGEVVAIATAAEVLAKITGVLPRVLDGDDSVINPYASCLRVRTPVAARV